MVFSRGRFTRRSAGRGGAGRSDLAGAGAGGRGLPGVRYSRPPLGARAKRRD
jgi:hypothetical protein